MRSLPGLTLKGQSVIDWLPRQKFFITGGGGALGYHLTRRLIELGANDVVVFDQNIATSRVKEFRDAPVRFIQGDILKAKDLESAISQCTIVFHLAALTHIGRSNLEPLKYLEVNGLATGYVLEACRKKNVKKFIYASTSHVYGNPLQERINEFHRTQPLSIYAASKLSGEAAIYGYLYSYGIHTVIARLSNLYGSSLTAETVIGQAVDQVINGRPIQLKNLKSIRDFIYVSDAVEALIRLADVDENRAESHVVNVSTGKGVSIATMTDILMQAAEKLGLDRVEIIKPQEEVFEKVPALVLDNSRLISLTGWSPQVDLQEGLVLTLSHTLEQKGLIQ
jgi:UDP-glucose 4-epimerase